MTIRAGEAAGIPVSMCGEMAADPRYTRLLLGLGLREFSMQPSCLLEVKRIINNSHTGVLRDELAGLDGLYSSEEVSHLVDRVNQSVAAMLV
jgi:phosphotransferase system enzyme I (PtsI)